MKWRTAALVVLFTGFLYPVSAVAQGNLENPRGAGAESGVTVVSGWFCDAQTIEIEFPPPPECNFAGGKTLFEAAYGTFRGDTQEICGDTDNGFSLLVNYSNCADGMHTVRALADGIEFDRATFLVTTFGVDFLPNADGLAPATVIQQVGSDADIYEVLLEWQQSKQNFVIVEVEKLPITLGQFLGAAVGPWSGTWQSLGASGQVSFTFNATPQMTLGISNVTLTGTGCAPNAVSTTEIEYIDLPITDVTMTDGSMVRIHFYPTENLQMSSGTFWFSSGPCAGLEGVITASRAM